MGVLRKKINQYAAKINPILSEPISKECIRKGVATVMVLPSLIGVTSCLQNKTETVYLFNPVKEYPIKKEAIKFSGLFLNRTANIVETYPMFDKTTNTFYLVKYSQENNHGEQGLTIDRIVLSEDTKVSTYSSVFNYNLDKPKKDLLSEIKKESTQITTDKTGEVKEVDIYINGEKTTYSQDSPLWKEISLIAQEKFNQHTSNIQSPINRLQEREANRRKSRLR